MARKFRAILAAIFLRRDRDQFEILRAVQRGGNGFGDVGLLAIGRFRWVQAD